MVASAAATLLAVAALAGCSDDAPRGPGPVGPIGPVGTETGIAGSGDIVSERYDVGGFTEVVFASEGAVIITREQEASLVIEADDNLQQYLDAVVSGNVLEISTIDGVDIAPSQQPVFRIGIDDLVGQNQVGHAICFQFHNERQAIERNALKISGVVLACESVILPAVARNDLR